ncbi:hypothetical protein SCHPADRAFT_724041 [Schizopora paradoxa]|uniref:DUF6533 domain-containing protein n=1 Tax=Schizopora paradoxa TaxID=27342 RepID=A0A0H2R1B7_9AGAM|nr:hypothetical protein SCHPADRAFT_724041 [Schizopora paradoxa]
MECMSLSLSLKYIASSVSSSLQTKYAYFAAYAIVIYDHLLTLDIEIEHIWKQKFSAVTFLFFLTRYYFLLAINITLFFFIEPVVNTRVSASKYCYSSQLVLVLH